MRIRLTKPLGRPLTAKGKRRSLNATLCPSILDWIDLRRRPSESKSAFLESILRERMEAERVCSGCAKIHTDGRRCSARGCKAEVCFACPWCGDHLSEADGG
jgi:hypothetical protein